MDYSNINLIIIVFLENVVNDQWVKVSTKIKKSSRILITKSKTNSTDKFNYEYRCDALYFNILKDNPVINSF